MLQFALKAALVAQMETTNPATHVMGIFHALMAIQLTSLAPQVSPVVLFTGTISKGSVFTIPVPVILHIFLMFEKSTHILHKSWCAKTSLVK